MDAIEAFVSPTGGIGIRAARDIAPGSVFMVVDTRWVLDATVAEADPWLGPLLQDLAGKGTHRECNSSDLKQSVRAATV